MAQKLSGGVKFIRRRNNYPERARVGRKIKKKSHSAENCRTVPEIPCYIECREPTMSVHGNSISLLDAPTIEQQREWCFE